MTDDNNYSFMAEVNLDDAVEPELLEEGWEGEVRVTEVEASAEKNYLRLALEPQGVENGEFRSIRHLVFYPKLADGAVKVNNKKIAIKNFLKAFGVEQSDLGDGQCLVGSTVPVIVGIEPPSEDGKWPSKNKINRFL